MQKIILITGATSGFGKAIAEKFAAEAWSCIITGRRKDRLDQLAQELKQKFSVQVLPLNFDVRKNEEVTANLSSLPAAWQNIDVLVNNAGLALGRNNFNDCDLDDWDTMIDTNVKGLLYVTKAVVPYLINRNQGHIINMGSIAGKDVYPMGNVYNATKHAVNSLSQSLRMELLQHRIKVTAIHPGAADTEFSNVRFKGDQLKSDEVYEGYEPLHAKDIADITYYCATLPAHVCINDLVVTCTAQANSFLTFKG
ncbi:SDR family NAD(P)-dependent oxidoreductase [Haoranjiania flava]|uniref:SDR family NAD(P)-dependent oxidoreductase n=1 Tax=Haoranjiania flava TaxID=1856322 RepID=A0AAE3LR03_9BACT|nr:SDR family NAD(P)-dependent oxidoreductase [Haoranjiania flava]MCU7694980.1 SDR family NAD(P)-dependent oxidoreductase [Haoranjiania flava]